MNQSTGFFCLVKLSFLSMTMMICLNKLILWFHCLQKLFSQQRGVLGNQLKINSTFYIFNSTFLKNGYVEESIKKEIGGEVFGEAGDRCDGWSWTQKALSGLWFSSICKIW